MKRTLRILIIEDSEEDTLFLVRRLDRSGFAPIWRRVDTIELLRAALVEETWDIAFSDHSMPGLGIRDALALVKEQRLDFPLIVLSGAIKEEDAVAMLNAGAKDYILKDNLSRLIPVVERELRSAQVRREREEIEKVQRENQARKNAILDSALDAIVTIDHEGKIFEWNRAAEKTFGFRRADVLGREMAELIIPPALREQYRQGMAHYLATGEGRMLGQRIEMTGLRADATEFPVELTVTSVQVEGQPIFTGFIRDITERKRAEEALRQTERLYRQAITAADAVPYLYDYKTDTYGFIGEGIQNLTGYSALEMTPQLWNSLTQETIMRGEAAGLVVEEAIRLTRAGAIKHWQSDCVIRTRDGRKRWVADSSIEMRDGQGNAKGSIGILMDITERRQLEEQLRQSQKMESIGQLAAGVAHDFNNILAVIQGHTDMILGGMVEGKDAEESLKQVSAAAKRAANLTRQLLAFSRKQQVQAQDLNLNTVVQGMSQMLMRLLGAPISLEFKVSPELPSVNGDFGMMEQILLNLAVNARDAMPRDGRLTITTAARKIAETEIHRNPEARAGWFVRLSVADTGAGIAPEILPRIFEPFFTTKEAGKGTGLGLATVYGIVKQHQGWIEVESQVGRGTTFNVFLPANAQTIASSTLLVAPTTAKGGGETILIAEDDPALRRLAARILRNLGYEVLEAGSGVEAIGVWEHHGKKVDLLLADLVMPDGLTGRELAKQMATREAGLKVIYSSGYSPGIKETAFIFHEGTNFLQKPYPADKLAETVRLCLDQK
jgi:two-component system, cell cycle sensor histidine kinase and response regulator CckA